MTREALFRSWCAAAALLALGGCAAAVQANQRQPGSVAGGAFKPARAGAAEYGPNAEATCPRAGAFQLLSDELAGIAKRAGRPAPAADPRLCAAADTFLGWDEAGGPPRAEVVAFVSRHFGLPTAARQVFVATLETEDVRIIAEKLREPAGEFALNAQNPRFGAATQRLAKNSTRVALVVEDAAIELEPLPRRLPPGGQATLSGRLLPPLANPKVLVSDVSGKVSTPAPAPGQTFRAELRCGDKPGELRVEIRGVQDGAERTAANFPIACGKDLPSSIALAAPSWPADVAGQERKLLELVNAERAGAGLPALAWSDGVARVARAVSEKLRDSAGSSAAVDLGPLLRSEGVSSPLVLQNPAQARSAQDAHERFLASPTNRANALNPEVNTAGVGVAPATDGSGTVYVTELFTQELQATDARAARGRLRAEIQKKRAAAGNAAPVSDPTLEELAQRYAAELAASEGAPSAAKIEPIESALGRYRSVSLLTGAKADAAELAGEPSLASGGRLLGVGVAQGKHPVLGRNASYVVIMTASPREGATPPAKPAPAPKAGSPYLPRK